MPADPRLVALYGRRHAPSYDFCSCGEPKGRGARRCWECRLDQRGGPFLVFRGRAKRRAQKAG